MNLLGMFAMMFILASVLISMQKANPSPEREGKYVIEATWNEGVDADIDLWVKSPSDEKAGFFNRDQGTLSLYRDDLGSSNDWALDANGQRVLNPLNREETTIRTPLIGEYLVNLHYFRAGADVPKEGIKAKVALKRIKDNYIFKEVEVTLEKAGDEMSALKFSLDKDQNVTEIEKPDQNILWVVNARMGQVGGP
jgi:hypothetical protein